MLEGAGYHSTSSSSLPSFWLLPSSLLALSLEEILRRRLLPCSDLRFFFFFFLDLLREEDDEEESDESFLREDVEDDEEEEADLFRFFFILQKTHFLKICSFIKTCSDIIYMSLSALYLPSKPSKDENQLTSSPLLRSYAISQRWSGCLWLSPAP